MYKDILAKIYQAFPMFHRVGKSAYKEGLENIEQLAELTNQPQNKFASIHIAGTNGKGSVAHLMASYCQELGLNTGLFTSPHLVDFRERIRINGKMISEDAVVDFFDKYQTRLDEISPSFFEMTTILAFDYFANQQVDVAVVEVGLGGRLDSTNIITPIASIITNISLEHTQLLGDTLAKIAAEKGGIIKNNVPVVIGEFQEETYPVFQKLSHERQAPLILANQYSMTSQNIDATSCSLDIYHNSDRIFSNVKSPLSGEYELKNINTFLHAVEFVRDYFHKKENPIVEAIEKVISNTHLMGRWQVIQEKPLTICDVGHNPGGLSQTMLQLKSLPHRKIHFLIGFVNDKDVDTILNFLPQDAIYYLCQADIERALSPAELMPKFLAHGLEVVQGDRVANTYSLVKFNALNEDVVFVGGSCFVVGDFLKMLQK